jgi:hypothetical protein
VIRRLTEPERVAAIKAMTADDMRWALRYLAGHDPVAVDLAIASVETRRRRIATSSPAETPVRGGPELDPATEDDYRAERADYTPEEQA